MAQVLGLGLEVLGDLLHLPLGAELLVEPHQRLPSDQVDDALVVALGPDGQLDDGGVGAEAIPMEASAA